MKTLGLTLVTFFAFTSFAHARGFRGAQIPNTPNACGVCHMSEAGGDARNPFGVDVEMRLTQTGTAIAMGNVMWGPVLAQLDSDGDGITNGTELGDPNGTWMMGDPMPGGDISNPGNPDDPNPRQNPDDDDSGGCRSVNGQTITWPLLAVGFGIWFRRRRARG